MNSNPTNIDPKYDISGLEIKPRLNLTWYNDKDLYSDGTVEDEIIQILIENDIEDFSQAIYKNFSWPTYYHLTHIRKNILNWYPFKKEDSILEIGCGMGAITNMLCDKCGKVTAVELSKRRATATLLRCRNQENLDIIVGNLNDIQFKEKFDYITLIGVLEYQGHYTDSDNPYKDFLIKISNLLKPGGKLLLAIENKYGAKYWCGAREDHTGIPFDGLNQYNIGNKNARTFSKQELKELLEKSGYSNNFFYYPMPDYKMPTVIYSEDYLPKDNNMYNLRPYYVPNSKSLLINEKYLYHDIIENDVFEFFSNSFLIECSTSDDYEDRIIFSALSSQRNSEYRIGTSIRKDKKVIKHLLEGNKGIQQHIEQTAENMCQLNKIGLETISLDVNDNILMMDYMEEPNLEEVLIKYYKDKNIEKIWDIYNKMLLQIEQSSEEADASENFIYELGIDTYSEEKDYGKIMRIGYIDLIPRNCFVKNDKWLWYDQEWKLDNIPSKYIFYKGILEMYHSYPQLGKVISAIEIAEKYKFLSYIPSFNKLSEVFADSVMDNYHLYCYSYFTKTEQDTYVQNIAKLI